MSAVYNLATVRSTCRCRRVATSKLGSVPSSTPTLPLTHRAVLGQLARTYKDRTALYGRTGPFLTYGELDRCSDALASALLDRGLRPGEKVAWAARTRPEFFVAYFGTAKSGLAFVPVNYLLRPDEAAALLHAVAPAAVIASTELSDSLDQALATAGARPSVRIVLDRPVAGWSRWDDVLRDGPSVSNPADDERRIHEIIFTSGTTGRPKGVTRSQRKRILDAYRSALAFRLSPDDHLLLMSPQHHIGGAATPCQVLLQGGAVTAVDFNPGAIAEAVGGGVTFLAGVPTHFLMIFASGELDRSSTGQVRGCKLGGSAGPPSLFGAIREHFPNADLCSGYGMTEAGPHTLACRGMGPDEPFLLGHPVPGNELRVVGDGGAEVSTGETGVMQIRSDVLFDGYLGQPELTASAFDGDWFDTGDLGWRDEDGRFFFAGRAKDMIITGGINVYPTEVEAAISAIEGVAEVAVLGLPDELFVEKVVAVVKIRPGASTTEGAVTAAVRSRLAGFKCPRELYFCDSLPQTASGKIDREALQQQILARGRRAASQVPGAKDIE
jgi:fatty-acyl-CoA synthase